ncbi:MAG: DUF5711 family protein [Lachnospiraceae bacterium]|nr:DUF5711 family protein [Lachnospiraceae bacterium]
MRYDKDNEYEDMPKKQGKLIKTIFVLLIALALSVGIYDTFFGDKIIKTAAESILKYGSVLVNKDTSKKSTLSESIKIEEDSRSTFVSYDNAFMQCTKDGIKYFVLGEDQKWNDTYTMANPYVVSEGGYTAVFEPMGRVIKLYDKSGIINTINTDGAIMRLSLNESGYVGVILNNSSSYSVNVFDGIKNACLVVRKEEDENIYPVDIDISDDNKVFAVSYIDASDVETASKVLFFYTYENDGKDYPDSMFAGLQKEDVIIPYIRFMSSGMLVVLSDSSLIGVSSSGVQEWELPLSNEIDGVSFENKSFAVLACGDELAGKEGSPDGSLIFVNMKGKISHQIETGEKITYMKGSKDNVIVGNSGEYTAFSCSSGKALWEYNPGYSVSDIISLNGGENILVVDKTQARVLGLSDENNDDSEGES